MIEEGYRATKEALEHQKEMKNGVRSWIVNHYNPVERTAHSIGFWLFVDDSLWDAAHRGR
jgi:hypothetical protein